MTSMTAEATIEHRRKRTGSATRIRILDAAEIEFSNNGYQSCSLRSISDSYDINLGLIHYYFGGKENLFTEVFLRRSHTLINRRQELLNFELAKSNNEPLDIAEIVRCYVIPTMEMMQEGEGPRAYIRLQSLLRTDTSSFARKLRDEAFSPTNRIFIRELQRSCPHLSSTSVVWRFSAMVGAFYALISNSSRVSELSGGLADSDDVEALFTEVIPFIAGGFSAGPPNPAQVAKLPKASA